jgi:hypothetical protein
VNTSLFEILNNTTGKFDPLAELGGTVSASSIADTFATYSVPLVDETRVADALASVESIF